MRIIKAGILIYLFFLISCTSNIEKSSYNYDLNLTSSDSLNLESKALALGLSSENSLGMQKVSKFACDTINIEVWQFHHFEPADTKFIGIWPSVARVNNFNRLKQLKSKWGFTYLFQQAHLKENDFKQFQEAGFKKNEIMIHLNLNYQNPPENWVDKYKDVFAYYIDEPYAVQPNYSLSEFMKLHDKIKMLDGTLLITGDFKPSNCLDEFVEYCDQVMFSSYHRTYQLFGCVFLHWPENIDQSGSWDVMKDRYGDKFTSSWIGALQDTLEYYNLFKEASKLNLKSIWLYQLEDTSDQYTDINLSKFCEAAWENGYLKKINEKINYKFICSEDSCNCDKSDKNAWKFLSKNSLKIYQEVERQIND